MTDPAAPIPTDQDDVMAPLFDALESNLPRIVAVFGPIVLVAVTALCAWLQNLLGIDLSPAMLQTFVLGTLLVGLGSLVTWLRGRAMFDTAAITAALTPAQPPLPPGHADDLDAGHPDEIADAQELDSPPLVEGDDADVGGGLVGKPRPPLTERSS